jgi:hypothetical protein
VLALAPTDAARWVRRRRLPMLMGEADADSCRAHPDALARRESRRVPTLVECRALMARPMRRSPHWRNSPHRGFPGGDAARGRTTQRPTTRLCAASRTRRS